MRSLRVYHLIPRLPPWPGKLLNGKGTGGNLQGKSDEGVKPKAPIIPPLALLFPRYPFPGAVAVYPVIPRSRSGEFVETGEIAKPTVSSNPA